MAAPSHEMMPNSSYAGLEGQQQLFQPPSHGLQAATQFERPRQQNRTPLRSRVETPIHPPQIPTTSNLAPKPPGYQNPHQIQPPPQHTPPLPARKGLQPQITGPVFHRLDPNNQYPQPQPFQSFQHPAQQAHNLQQANQAQQAQQALQVQHQQAQTQQILLAQQQQQQQQQAQQHRQQHAHQQFHLQQPLPQTPQQSQAQRPQEQQSNQDQDESMLDGDSQDDESDGDGDGDGGGDGGEANVGEDGQPLSPSDPKFVAPLAQPVTPLQLPKVRPTLMIGPYEQRQDAFNAVQEYAISQGYMLVQSGCAKAKTPSGKYESDAAVVRVDLMCDRGGSCKNQGTGVRKRPTHRIGCPARMKLVCRKRQASKWFIDVRCEEHNHDLDPKNITSIASYRRWRRIQNGGASMETHSERYKRVRKPKVIPPVPPPQFHQTGPQPPPPPTSPLHMAALRGQVKILEILLNKGADINALDATGRTPLHCAAEGERMDAVKLLVERGADVTRLDSKGLSALHVAVERGMEDAVVLLIEHGADPNQ